MENKKPPPIPGMRPPLGSPGGPVPAPKSSMGFVMPIYTICIIVFFVYTLSKILFKRTASPYEPVAPDPQFRRRVFRDDSRSSPDKLGHKETDTIVSAISGLVAEVTQQMEAGRAHTQQRQEVLDNARPYTNGTILHSGPVQIVASEYKEKTPEPQIQKEATPVIQEVDEPLEDILEADTDIKYQTIELIENEASQILQESILKPEIIAEETQKESEQPIVEAQQEVVSVELDEPFENLVQITNELIDTGTNGTLEDSVQNLVEESKAEPVINAELDSPIQAEEKIVADQTENLDLIKLTEAVETVQDDVVQSTEFLDEERKGDEEETTSKEDLLEEAIKDLSEEEHLNDMENQSVKVVGMEVTAHAADGSSYKPEPPKPPATPVPKTHEADEVQSIFLQTEIPQQSRVLVADFAEERPHREPRTHSPQLVVSGKITLSLIQDAPRDTPDRDLESTVDEFTTASAFTQPAAEKDLEDSDEEIEIEEEIDIEIEVEDEEEEDLEEKNGEVKKDAQK